MKCLRLFCLAALAFNLHAGTVVFNNTGELSIDPTDGGADPIAAEGPLYDSFTPDVSGLLSSLQLGLSVICVSSANGCPAGGSFQVALYASAGDTPGSTMIGGGPLLTLNDSSLTGGTAAEIYTYTIPVSVTLTAGTMYWIGLSGTTTEAQWSWPSTDGWNADPSGIPGGPGVGGNYYLNTAAGSPNLDGPDATPYLMSVTVSAAVPEPSSALLIVVGAGVLALLRRSARRFPSSDC